MHIKEFMNIKLLQNIQDEFSAATGLAAIAVDTDGNYITKASNFTDFCMKLTRGSKEGLSRCMKCDRECTGTYECHAGLMDFSVDIIVDGTKLGAMIGGQVLSKEPDPDKFARIAKELDINPERYIAAVKKIPVRSEKSIYAAARLLKLIVNQVVNYEYVHHQQKHRLSLFSKELSSITGKMNVILENAMGLEAIATQQKMLTLNASIEASRAGEAGTGFAVVATKMGEMTQESAAIYKTIQDSAKSVTDSITAINKIS